jgi:hypothetical protein
MYAMSSHPAAPPPKPLHGIPRKTTRKTTRKNKPKKTKARGGKQQSKPAKGKQVQIKLG